MKRRISVLFLALVMIFTMTVAASAAVPSQTFMLPEIGEAYSTNYFLNANYNDCMKKILDALNFRVEGAPAPKDVYFVISSTYTMNISKPTQVVTPTTDFPQVSYYSTVGANPVIYAVGNGDIITAPVAPLASAVSFNDVEQTIATDNTITIAVKNDTTAYSKASVTLDKNAMVTVASGSQSKTALFNAGTIASAQLIESITNKTEATGAELIAKSPITITLQAVDAQNQSIAGVQTVYTVNFVAQP